MSTVLGCKKEYYPELHFVCIQNILYAHMYCKEKDGTISYTYNFRYEGYPEKKYYFAFHRFPQKHLGLIRSTTLRHFF